MDWLIGDVRQTSRCIRWTKYIKATGKLSQCFVKILNGLFRKGFGKSGKNWWYNGRLIVDFRLI